MKEYRVVWAYGCYKRGQVLTMDDSTAKVLVARGFLAEVEPEIETATAAEPVVERATKKTSSRKRR